MEPPRSQDPAPSDADELAEDMLARFRDGDQAAFQAIVTHFEPRLVQFFYRLCWDRDRAEDFTQDLFLKLLRGARGYQPQGKLSTYIFRVATNLWIDSYRSAKPRGPLYSLDQVMLKGEPLADAAPGPGPADRLLLDEEKATLREALKSLTEPHRLVLELAVYQEMPYAQISSVLDIPVGTVKSRMHNCVRALREHMRDRSRPVEGEVADRAMPGSGEAPRRGESFRFPWRRAGGLR
ncbi:MAG: sigma-70 family RNA polymerase sigma factor [Planctomycetes bacterium]|nr:sigma-70 family RNA polymerase sigma factor [Planctomycetota bacterium]